MISKDNELDMLIRQGSLKEARSLLLKQEKHYSSAPIIYARFFRRIGDFKRALLILRPSLFHFGEVIQNPPPEIQIEYATSLSQLGLTREALQHLVRTPPGSFSFHLAVAFIHLKQMDFQSARTEFEKAERSNGATDYERLIAKTNILNCWLGECNYQAAVNFGEVVLQKLDGTNYRLLKMHTHHFLAQAEAFLNHAAQFEKHFNLAKEYSKDQLGHDPSARVMLELHRGQWISQSWLGDASQAGAFKKINFKRLCAAALALEEFETFRDLLLFREFSRARSGSAKLSIMLAGTPFSFYQRKAEVLLKKKIPPKLSSINETTWEYSRAAKMKTANMHSKLNKVRRIEELLDLSPGQVP